MIKVKLQPDVFNSKNKDDWSATRYVDMITWIDKTYPDAEYYPDFQELVFEDRDVAVHFKLVWG